MEGVVAGKVAVGNESELAVAAFLIDDLLVVAHCNRDKCLSLLQTANLQGWWKNS